MATPHGILVTAFQSLAIFFALNLLYNFCCTFPYLFNFSLFLRNPLQNAMPPPSPSGISKTVYFFMYPKYLHSCSITVWGVRGRGALPIPIPYLHSCSKTHAHNTRNIKYRIQKLAYIKLPMNLFFF